MQDFAIGEIWSVHQFNKFNKHNNFPLAQDLLRSLATSLPTGASGKAMSARRGSYLSAPTSAVLAAIRLGKMR